MSKSKFPLEIPIVSTKLSPAMCKFVPAFENWEESAASQEINGANGPKCFLARGRLVYGEFPRKRHF